MTPTEQAARWLEDVPRLAMETTVNGEQIIVCNDGPFVRYDRALAAIARHLAPGDDLVERLLSWDGCWPAPWIERALPEAAARISALTVERDIHAKKGQEWAEIAHAATAKGMRAEAEVSRLRDRLARVEGARKTFPLLGGGGVGIDWQLVQEHAGQARTNHGQTLEELGRRGGLSWCELYAVLHDRRWQKMDSNDAMIACRSLETRYLAALTDGGSNG